MTESRIEELGVEVKVVIQAGTLISVASIGRYGLGPKEAADHAYDKALDMWSRGIRRPIDWQRAAVHYTYDEFKVTCEIMEAPE